MCVRGDAVRLANMLVSHRDGSSDVNSQVFSNVHCTVVHLCVVIRDIGSC